MNWFERHLHWTWLTVYIVTLVLIVLLLLTWVAPYLEPNCSPGLIHYFVLLTVYVAGLVPITLWVLKRKGRSKWWLALTLLVFRLTPLLLSDNVRKQRQIEEMKKKYKHMG
jgi:uncharacterized membrane protein